MAEIKLNIGSIDRKITKQWIKAINATLPSVKWFIEDLTPEDTTRLVNSYKIRWAKDEWNKIVWEVYTNVPYAIFVEYWVAWKAYRYNKPKWNIFNIWVWNRTFTRALDNNRETIKSLLQRNLW